MMSKTATGTKRCPVCLKPFKFERYTATYCSDKCRQRAHRKPAPSVAVKEAYDAAAAAMQYLASFTERDALTADRADRMLYSVFVAFAGHLSDGRRRELGTQLRDSVTLYCHDKDMEGDSDD